jgi:hypothetical protein
MNGIKIGGYKKAFCGRLTFKSCLFDLLLVSESFFCFCVPFSESRLNVDFLALSRCFNFLKVFGIFDRFFLGFGGFRNRVLKKASW